jgi:hypothetical protein
MGRAERKRKRAILGPDPPNDPLKWYQWRNRGFIEANLQGIWRGAAGFLVAGGPSLREIDLSFLKDRGVVSLGVNNVAAFAPVRAFTCSDPPEKFHHAIWLDPALMKIVPKPKMRQKIRIKHADGTFEPTQVKVRECPNVWGYERDCDFLPEEFLTRESASWGRNKSAVESRPGRDKLLFTFLLGLRLMHALGCRRVYLLGVDFGMTTESGYAFAQNRTKGACRSNTNSYRVAAKWCHELRPIFEKAGYEIYQTNPHSNLRVWDYVPLEDAICDARGTAGNDPLDTGGWYEKPGDDEAESERAG